MSGTISSGIVCFLFLFVLTGMPVNGSDNSGFSAKHSAQRTEKCMGLNSHLRGVRLEPSLPHGFHGGDFPCPPARNHSLEVVRQGPRLAAGVLALLFSDSNSLVLAPQDVLAL